MKVIFLDMDGVLCTMKAHTAFHAGFFMRHLDTTGVRLLSRLCMETGALLVLSSTWREHFDQAAMNTILMNSGFDDVKWHQGWKTPSLRGPSRGEEIEKWMATHGYPDKYVIIDDDTDMLENQKPFFIQTEMGDGFGYHHYTAALKILNREVQDEAE